MTFRSHLHGLLTFFLWTAWMGGATAAPLQPVAAVDYHAHKSDGPVVILPGAAGSVQHYPGREYKSGRGWWALNCDSGCTLSAQQLDVASLDHEVYQGDPVPGQQLSFSPGEEAGMVLLFKPIRLPKPLKLAAGPVPTYYGPAQPSRVRRPPGSPGTMEWEILIERASPLRFVPTFLAAAAEPVPADMAVKKEKKATPDPHAVRSGDLHLEVQRDGRRQVLGKFEFGIEGPRSMTLADYLLWAGDLDGDGKPDFLVNLDFHGTDIALFLSSLAEGDEIAHEAGRFTYFPVDSAGC